MYILYTYTYNGLLCRHRCICLSVAVHLCDSSLLGNILNSCIPTYIQMTTHTDMYHIICLFCHLLIMYKAGGNLY